MKIKFSEIEFAFQHVCTGGYGGNSALLDKKTGEIYYRSDFAGIDEIPEEAYESENTIEIPHKNDLDLGTRLVFRFVREVVPDGYDEVDKIFSRRSAYAYYKDFLESKGLLEQWYAYSNAAEEEALREWCADNGIELVECGK